MRFVRTITAALALCACTTASAQVAPLPMALCAGWQGARVCEQLHEDTHVRVLRCTFPPGVGHEMHYHPPHFGYVLAGDSVMRITTDQGAVDRPVHAGQTFSNDAEVRHAALNIGDQTTVYLIVEKKYLDTRTTAERAPGLCAA
ncbi:cupin domain-containing protein [Terricaulis sp.]|uniref:cupin domain-containing protein n=1 Tax=Terricaulis sp. TaxID=2768686 RepID=UPI003783614F